VSAVELPASLIAQIDYPACDVRTPRPAGITERCARPSEWLMRCNRCGLASLLCEEHKQWYEDRQKPVVCAGCKQWRLVPLGWSFSALRRS
jgi:hypothetical protein